MSFNSIENATRYSTELDKLFAQKSATGFFADNALAAKFVGAKTVILPLTLIFRVLPITTATRALQRALLRLPIHPIPCRWIARVRCRSTARI